MDTISFMSQEKIFNPENQKSEIKIIGAGSTGSFIALTLAKMGFNKIEVIDFDVVEPHNIPNQFYRLSDKDAFKVDALQGIIEDFTGVEISFSREKIDENSNIDLNLNTIVIFCLDNIESRQIIFDKIKEYPIKLIDTRMGGEGFSIHSIDLSNEIERQEYDNSLKVEIKDTPCGEKGIIYTILSIAAETSNIVKRIDQNEVYPKILRREMKTYRFISNLT